MIAQLALLAGTVLTLAMIVPQIVRIRRRRTAIGVSPAWPVLGTVLNGAWTGYLITVSLLLATAVTITMTVTYTVLAALVLSLYPERRVGAILQGLGVALALVAVGAIGGWSAVGTVLGFSYGAQLTPAIVSVYRSHDLDGVSRATWWIALVEAVCWGFYGLSTGDGPVIIYGVTGVACTAAICARLVWVDARAQARGSAKGSAKGSGVATAAVDDSSRPSVQAE